MNEWMNDEWRCRGGTEKQTSKRFCLVGTSTPQANVKLVNWAEWWPLRKDSTGTIPEGWTSNSSSSPAANCNDTIKEMKKKQKGMYVPERAARIWADIQLQSGRMSPTSPSSARRSLAQSLKYWNSQLGLLECSPITRLESSFISSLPVNTISSQK